MTVYITKKIGVLTSGGDAPGMNAAIRAIVRTCLERGAEIFAIYEGYQGLVDGGDRIKRLDWNDVGGILHLGGTIIGTARCEAFRSREGRRKAALNLLKQAIDSLIIIGGDGSLTGANIFRQEWPELLAELVEDGEIPQKTAEEHPFLSIVGLVGSIDNDFYGTDMTIGADTALHRITDAIDAIGSTAASHQRTFVIEVMGRNCGYLALMSAIATGADWVFIPECPPSEGWEQKMVQQLKDGRKAGRRDSIVILAEGARDDQGKPISSAYVQKVLQDSLKVDVRITVLGHVQRGGSPSAFDRNLGTFLGYAAIETILSNKPQDEPLLIGFRGNRIINVNLMDCVSKTQQVAEAINRHDYSQAMELRGASFKASHQIFNTLTRPSPHPPKTGQKRYRIAILNAGSPAAGMNTAVRAAVRHCIDKGHIVLGVNNGFKGLIEGDISELTWMSVNGWANRGGSELGTNRILPKGTDFYAIARNIEGFEIHGLLIIGGWEGYKGAFTILEEREHFKAFNIPIVLIPASINNNLPGSELSIGADTALNNIVEAVDKIKQSAVASRRCFVIETMGRYCGYLSLMGGIATGAEKVYLHEEGITLRDLQEDIDLLVRGFRSGKRLGLMIRDEEANPVYTTAFIKSLFEEEGGDLFDVRQAILGHLQQGGDPSPFDRILATRFAHYCANFIIEQLESISYRSAFIGLEGREVKFHDLEDFPRMVDMEYQRPKQQWWLDLRPIARLLAKPGPSQPPDWQVQSALDERR